MVPFALGHYVVHHASRWWQEPIVGLIGSMHWEPSRSAAERLISRIWPLVKQRFPQAKLFIAGWNAAKYLQQYSSQPDLNVGEQPRSIPSEFFSARQ